MAKVIIKQKLNMFEKHQLSIARKTLNLSDAGAFILGGPTKIQSRAFIDKMKAEGKIRK